MHGKQSRHDEPGDNEGEELEPDKWQSGSQDGRRAEDEMDRVMHSRKARGMVHAEFGSTLWV